MDSCHILSGVPSCTQEGEPDCPLVHQLYLSINLRTLILYYGYIPFTKIMTDQSWLSCNSGIRILLFNLYSNYYLHTCISHSLPIGIKAKLPFHFYGPTNKDDG